MSNSNKSFFQVVWDFIVSLFGRKKPTTPPQPEVPSEPEPVDDPNDPAEVTISKVLVIVFDPVMDPVMDPATGKKLSEQLGWGRAEDLATGFMADILQNSHGMARY
ncbi:MAG: hypothetical protein PVJ21_21675, partial [Anaerolineales bacterium]